MASSSFAPFRQRAYLLVWLGALVSNIGTWMEVTALSYFVANHGSASASGLVAAAGFLPNAVLGPVGGAWADRFDRRRIMIGANALAATIAGSVAVVVATGHATPKVLAVFSFVEGCAGAIGFPAFQATLPDLVPKDDLVSAIGLSSIQWNLGRIVGPTAAAVAIAIGGIPGALWFNAASFLAVIVAVLFARIPKRIGTKRSVLRSIRDGIGFARKAAAVRAMVPVMALTVFVGAPFIGLIAQMATNVFHTKQGGTSLLVTCQGIGAVVAGVSIGPLSTRYGLRAVMVGAVSLMAPALVLYGTAPNIVVAGIGLIATGGCYMGAVSSFTSITQRSATPETGGRAMVINNFVLGAAYPLGLLVQGAIADRSSLRSVTVGSGIALGIWAATLLVFPKRLTDPIAATA